WCEARGLVLDLVCDSACRATLRVCGLGRGRGLPGRAVGGGGRGPFPWGGLGGGRGGRGGRAPFPESAVGPTPPGWSPAAKGKRARAAWSRDPSPPPATEAPGYRCGGATTELR